MSLKAPKSRIARVLDSLGALPLGRFLLILAVWACLSRLPFVFTDLLNNDEGGWWMGAKIWLSGGVPYLDFIDNKPPLIYLLYALPQLIGIHSLNFMHALSLPLICATGYLAGKLAMELAPVEAARRHSGVRLIALLYVGLSALGPSRQFLPLNTEHAAMLPMVWTMLYYSRARLGLNEQRNLALAGALFAIAGLLRQSLLFATPLLALELLWAPLGRAADEEEDARVETLGALKRWIFFGAGFLLINGLFVAYLAANNAVGEAFFWIVMANSDTARHSPDLAYHLLRFSKNVLPSMALALPLWILALRGMRRECWADAPRFRLTILWMGSAAVALWTGSLGGRWLGHYYIPVLAPLAAVAGARLLALLSRDESAGTLGARLGGSALVLVSAGALIFGGANIARTLRGGYEEVGPVLNAAAARIDSLTDEDDPVFVWGFAQGLYYKARRLPSNRFIAPNTPITGYMFGAERAFDELDLEKLVLPEQFEHFIGDLKRGRPKLFLDYAENDFHYFGRHKIERFPTLQQWLSENYRRLPDEGPIVFYERIDRR